MGNIISAGVLENQLVDLTQRAIRAKGNRSRKFTLRVYNNADDTATYWITRYTYYNFSGVTIPSIPASVGAAVGELISPDSVLRMQKWLIDQMVTKWKAVMNTRKYVDGRV